MRISEITNYKRDFYHGCASAKAAKAIVKNGLIPPDLSGVKKNNLTPVEGRVYMTPDLSYALIYAFGANMVGNKVYQLPYRGNEEKFSHIFNNDPTSRHNGRMGYLFVIPEDQLADLYPDEDQIGELYSIIMRKGPSRFIENSMKTVWENYSSDRSLMTHFEELMMKSTTPKERDKIRDGEYEYFARAGKKALKTMPQWMRERFAQMGMHVSHHGKVTPTQVWEIDKTQIGYYNRDGSNFFQLAKRIR